VPPARKLLLAAVLFLLGYATMQATRCDRAAERPAPGAAR
jgi:hypothetical protein